MELLPVMTAASKVMNEHIYIDTHKHVLYIHSYMLTYILPNTHIYITAGLTIDHYQYHD